jgi:glycosyltransferase involved in cell wall biosynthesis
MASGGGLVLRKAITSVTSQAPRLVRLLPSPVAGSLRWALTEADRFRPVPALEDWSRPLIAGARGTGATGDAEHGVVEPVSSTRSQAGAQGSEPSGVRCLVVSSRLDVGGMDEVAAFLGRRLPDHGLKTAVLHALSDQAGTTEASGRLARMLDAQGIEVHAAGAEAGQRWIEQWRPDVISAHGAPDWVVSVAESLGVPYVDNLHGMHMLFGADWTEEAKRGMKVSAVVAVSELVRQQYLAGNAEYPPDRIVTIPNGVDDQRRSGGDRAAARAELGVTDEFLFVSLARHCLQKNTYGLIAAFGEVAAHRPSAHLVLAGSTDNYRYYGRLAHLRDSLPCRDSIHLRDHAAVPAKLLAAADGFVMDSFFEGWSLASMEALYTGVPVVLSDVGGAREQVGDDPDRGFVVSNPLGDPLSVDWGSIGAARYRRQVNRDELVAMMRRLVDERDHYLRRREQLAVESAVRFSAGACLAKHAHVLTAVANGATLPVLAGL